jgi:hypothetical protein
VEAGGLFIRGRHVPLPLTYSQHLDFCFIYLISQFLAES